MDQPTFAYQHVSIETKLVGWLLVVIGRRKSSNCPETIAWFKLERTPEWMPLSVVRCMRLHGHVADILSQLNSLEKRR